MGHLGFDVRVEVETGETSRLNVVADGDEKEALGALIGRKGERLSALQHLVNLMLSKEMGPGPASWSTSRTTAAGASASSASSPTRPRPASSRPGKMLQLEPMSALERRWIHLSLRDHPASRRSRSARSRTGGSSSFRATRLRRASRRQRRRVREPSYDRRQSHGRLTAPRLDRMSARSCPPPSNRSTS
jgi:hypothetical protein